MFGIGEGRVFERGFVGVSRLCGSRNRSRSMSRSKSKSRRKRNCLLLYLHSTAHSAALKAGLLSPFPGMHRPACVVYLLVQMGTAGVGVRVGFLGFLGVGAMGGEELDREDAALRWVAGVWIW